MLDQFGENASGGSRTRVWAFVGGVQDPIRGGWAVTLLHLDEVDGKAEPDIADTETLTKQEAIDWQTNQRQPRTT